MQHQNNKSLFSFVITKFVSLNYLKLIHFSLGSETKLGLHIFLTAETTSKKIFISITCLNHFHELAISKYKSTGPRYVCEILQYCLRSSNKWVKLSNNRNEFNWFLTGLFTLIWLYCIPERKKAMLRCGFRSFSARNAILSFIQLWSCQ